MATKTAILSVKIVSDAKDFSRKMDESVSKLDKFKATASKLAVPAAAVLSGLGAIALGVGKVASEAQQNFGAVDAVFKEHAQNVIDMSKVSAQNLGISASDYAKYSALIGSQLKNAGVPMDQLSGQTNKLIGYGADFAAMFGGTVPEAVEAISSALKGEMDPIEKYGISLSETKIKAQMAADGTDQLTGSAYDAAKAQAIMTLIQQQGADSMGAFGREAGTAAGQQAIMTAKWQDASAALGEALLPMMTKAAEVLAQVATWVSQNIGIVQGLAVAIGILAGGILVLNGVMMIMNIIAAVNPFVILAVAVVALAGIIIYLATQTTFFQDVWRTVSQFCMQVWAQFVVFIRNAWVGFIGFIMGAIANIVSFFRSGFTSVASFIAGVVNNIRSFFQSGFNAVSSVVAGVISSVISTISNLRNSASNILNAIGNIFSSVFNGARNTVVGVINTIANAFGNITSAVQGAIDWVGRLFNMGGMPGWLKDVLGMGGTGFSGEGFAAPTVDGFGLGATGTTDYRPILFNNAHKFVIDVEVNDVEAKKKLKALTEDREASIKIDADFSAAEKWLQEDHSALIDFTPRGAGQAIAHP